MWDAGRWKGESDEALFATVHYEPVGDAPGSWYHGTAGRLRFTDGSPEELVEPRTLEVLRRLRVANGPHAVALRKEIRSLALETRSRLGGPLDVSLLTGLTALERVYLYSFTGMVGASALAELPALREATLFTYEHNSLRDLEGIARSQRLESLELYYGGLGNLRALSGMRSLRRLCIHEDGPLSLDGIEGLPIEELEVLVRGSECDLSALGSLRTLRTLTFHGSLSERNAWALAKCRVPVLRLPYLNGTMTDPATLAALPDVGEVELILSRLDTARDAAGPLPMTVLSADVLDDAGLRLLARAPRLRTLHVDVLAATNLAPLADLPELRGLRFRVARQLQSLDRVPRATFLNDPRRLDAPNRLVLRKAPLTSIRQLGHLQGVEHLDLSGCTGLTSLWGLEGMDELRLIDLRGCSGLIDMTSLEALPALRTILVNDRGPLEPFPPSVRKRVSR